MSRSPSSTAGRRRPGAAYPLGATISDGGTNFAVASEVAEAMVLCLFDDQGTETQVELRNVDAGVFHGFVPGIGAGQAYGFRAHGPFDPCRGIRTNPNKLLLDPYARAIHGEVTFGREVLGHDHGERISTPEQVVTYIQALAAAAPERTRLVEYARTWEGRPLYYLVIGSPERIADLDALKADLQRLAKQLFIR